MPQRASNYEFTDRIIHKVKTEGLRESVIPLLFEDDFNSYSDGSLQGNTNGNWTGHNAGSDEIRAATSINPKIDNQRVSMGGGGSPATRAGSITPALNWDISKDYSIECDIHLSGVADERLGMWVEGPDSGNLGNAWIFNWGNFQIGNDVIFTINGPSTPIQVFNVSYLPALTAVTFTAKVIYTASTGNWTVFVNDTLQHTVARPGGADTDANAGIWGVYTSGNHVLGDFWWDNFVLRGFGT